ncbi:MAG: glycosyltransferase family 2 protein [Methylophilaceae bacterium]
MSSNKKIAISSVNYKTADLALNSCALIVEKFKQDCVIFIVDNFSQDGSDSVIAKHIVESNWSSQVKLIALPKNGGFAYGSNAGIREALKLDCDYIMLLNPDTEIREGAIAALADFLDSHPEVGVAGSQLENQEGGAENSAHYFPTPVGELLDSARLGILTRLLSKYEVTPPRQNVAHQCDWVSGSSMMVRREVFESVGLLDESYFLYFEEVDFFYRVSKAGWQTWYVPDSKVMHIEGVSTGIKSNKRRPSYWYESRRRFFIKHHGVIGLVLADVFWALGRISYALRKMLGIGKKQKNHDPRWLAYDLLKGDIISILTGRAWRLEKEKII